MRPLMRTSKGTCTLILVNTNNTIYEYTSIFNIQDSKTVLGQITSNKIKTLSRLPFRRGDGSKMMSCFGDGISTIPEAFVESTRLT